MVSCTQKCPNEDVSTAGKTISLDCNLRRIAAADKADAHVYIGATPPMAFDEEENGKRLVFSALIYFLILFLYLFLYSFFSFRVPFFKVLCAVGV